MKLKILIIADNLNYSNGGAEISIQNLEEGLNKYGSIETKIFTNKIRHHNLDILSFIYSFKILGYIMRFKPHIIITQRLLSIPTIIIGKLLNISVINIIRDPSMICAKYNDYISEKESCEGMISIKHCIQCISKFKKFPKKLFYIFRYLICKLNFIVYNIADINLVASKLMARLVNQNVYFKKIKVAKIVPIKFNFKGFQLYDKYDYSIFISPKYNNIHKGLEFLKRLDYPVIVFGADRKGFENNLMYAGRYSKNIIQCHYIHFKFTLVPSIYNEAFGRVIVESVLAGTPVLCSYQCGASEYFKDKWYVRSLILDKVMWNDLIQSDLDKKITKTEIKEISKRFSIESCTKDVLHIILDYLKKKLKNGD